MQDPAKCGQVAILKEAEEKEDINGNPSHPKSEDYAISEGPPIAHHVIENANVRSDISKFTERQPKKDEAVVQSVLKEASKLSPETSLSVSMLSPSDCSLTQALRESKQESTSVQRDRFNQKCQSGMLKKCITRYRQILTRNSVAKESQAKPLLKINFSV